MERSWHGSWAHIDTNEGEGAELVQGAEVLSFRVAGASMAEDRLPPDRGGVIAVVPPPPVKHQRGEANAHWTT
jgi:hypothetical protein